MKPITLLLVDDNRAFLRVADLFLRGQVDVAVVGAANDGEEALAKARELRPQVVLVDLAMPRLPGLEVISRLRDLMPEVGIVALTLLDTEAYRQAALARGADAFVGKATLTTDLLPAIRRVGALRGAAHGRGAARWDGEEGDTGA
jgi:DNA-binding NarL/FixJ family response regulator